jgi:hypothetical protein
MFHVLHSRRIVDSVRLKKAQNPGSLTENRTIRVVPYWTARQPSRCSIQKNLIELPAWHDFVVLLKEPSTAHFSFCVVPIDSFLLLSFSSFPPAHPLVVSYQGVLPVAMTLSLAGALS